MYPPTMPWHGRDWWSEFFKNQRDDVIWCGAWLDRDSFTCDSTPFVDEPHHNIHLIELKWHRGLLTVRIRRAGDYRTTHVLVLSRALGWYTIKNIMEETMKSVQYGTLKDVA